MMLFSPGAPLTPIGGSSWSLRKSRINLRRAAVDMIVLEIEFNKIQQFKQFQCGHFIFKLCLQPKQSDKRIKNHNPLILKHDHIHCEI